MIRTRMYSIPHATRHIVLKQYAIGVCNSSAVEQFIERRLNLIEGRTSNPKPPETFKPIITIITTPYP